MYFSKVISEAKLLNSEKPKFDSFVKRYGKTPFQWLNEREYTPNDGYFVYNNYTPRAERMYLTEENALKIDGMRLDIEELFQEGVISKAEYSYLLASLLESVTKVSNTSGTYQAFFKFWESRALKKFTIMPLEMKDSLSVSKDNRCLIKIQIDWLGKFPEILLILIHLIQLPNILIRITFLRQSHVMIILNCLVKLAEELSGVFGYSNKSKHIMNLKTCSARLILLMCLLAIAINQ
uniref:DNA adenine methylase n=1 Tax=Lactococcus sp. TaxID=44273 RepID=UPI003D6C9292